MKSLHTTQSDCAPMIRNTESTSFSRSILKLGAGLMIAVAMAATSHAQTILVADPNGTNGVSSYSMNGTLINSSLIPGTTYEGLALSGSTLYVANPGPGTVNNALVGKYTLDGTGGVSSSNSYFVNGGYLQAPFGLAVTATNLFIADFNSSNVLKYGLGGNQIASVWAGLFNPYGLAVSPDGTILWVSETTGAGANTINGYSIGTSTGAFGNGGVPTITITSGLNQPHGLAVSGNTLYVANGGNGTISSFNATTGTSNGVLVSGLTGPQGITVFGSSLFVTGSDGTVKGFDASTGLALAGFTTITGLSSPYGIVVTEVPEPATFAALAGATILGFAALKRRRRVIV